jgi:hypothetical protein
MPGRSPSVPASLDLLHRLGEIGEIADATVAARHAIHLDAHFLDALHERGRAGIGRSLYCTRVAPRYALRCRALYLGVECRARGGFALHPLES